MSRKVAGPPEFYLRSIFLNDGRSSLQVMFFFSSGFKCLGVPPPVVGKIGGNATKRVLSIYAAPPSRFGAGSNPGVAAWFWSVFTRTSVVIRSSIPLSSSQHVPKYLAPHSDLKAALLPHTPYQYPHVYALYH